MIWCRKPQRFISSGWDVYALCAMIIFPLYGNMIQGRHLLTKINQLTPFKQIFPVLLFFSDRKPFVMPLFEKFYQPLTNPLHTPLLHILLQSIDWLQLFANPITPLLSNCHWMIQSSADCWKDIFIIGSSSNCKWTFCYSSFPVREIVLMPLRFKTFYVPFTHSNKSQIT